ncbi:MAG TPA: dicarboxylate/amino acid:cation symporter, partial [Caulobacteraceae bacterium]|nr:dicarboxylate/amino acid:cation symporter [Caulobacteraceae bacterium]
LTPAGAKDAASNLSIVTDLFLRLIKMVIAPLVFSTLVTGIAHMEDTAAIGRVGVKTLGWFVSAGIVSLSLGLFMVQLLHPGSGMALPREAVAAGGIDAGTFTLKDFVTHLIPTSIFDAMARNEILQIVVFSVFVGSAIAALGRTTPVLLEAAEQLASIMLKVTGFVMYAAPFAIFAALAATVATQGLGVLVSYAKFVGEFYLSLALLWALLIAASTLAVGGRVGALVKSMQAPMLVAFSTASSEAAFPLILDGLTRFGAPRRIVSFVLPLGYSFNLDGSMMYCTFATLFIAQAYGVHLSLAQQVTMLALLMVTSKGMAGVPRASLVVIAATLPLFHLPEAGLLLILGVDHLLDMGRSATNVVGNSVAAVVVSRWERQLGDAGGEAAAVAGAG